MSRASVLTVASLVALAPGLLLAVEKGPTLRILAPRDAGAEKVSSEATFESAGGARSGAGALPPRTSTTPGGSRTQSNTPPGQRALGAAPGSPAAARSGSPTAPPAANAASPKLTVGRPPVDPNSAEGKRIRNLNRVAAMNQATGPRDAGVPQLSGDLVPPKPAAAPRAPLPDRARTQSPPAPAASVTPVVAAPKEQSLSPVPAGPSAGADPMASEVARDGDFYFFAGAINGLPVRFRINESVFGIRMPSRVAVVAKAMPAGTAGTVATKGEVIAPVNSVSFGAYPVRAVMVKIYPDEQEEYVDIGLDALANFKVKSVNGRRLLVKGS